MIKKIDSKTYVSFLRRNKAEYNQVSINENGNHYGYYVNDSLLGVVSTLETKNTVRVKGLFVEEHSCNEGIGTKLVEYLIRNDKDMTAFSSKESRSIFKSLGFGEESLKPNDIMFMRRYKKMSPSIKDNLDKSLIELSKTILKIEGETDLRDALDYINKQLRKLI